MERTILFLIFASFVMSEFVQANNLDYKTLRWNLHPDKWFFKSEMLMKGRYFKIPRLTTITTNFKKIPVLNVYPTSTLSGEPVLRLGYRDVFKGDKKVCSEHLVEKKEIAIQYLKCGTKSCSKVLNSTPEIVNLALNMKYELKASETENCPFRVKMDWAESDEDDSFYLRFLKVSFDKSYLEIEIDNRSYYVDIRGCSKTNKECGVVDIRQSKLENQYAELIEMQKDKKLESLNFAIKVVLPCVKKRDYKCVKSFFETKETMEYDEFNEVELNETTMKELEACLRYESLLPHLQASKGVNKICILNYGNGNKPLVNVTYPEALSSTGYIYLPSNIN